MPTTAVKNDVTIDFGSIELEGVLHHDDDHRQLLLFTDEGTERLSVNLEAYTLVAEPGHVFIKDWSEHSGLAAALQTRGYVRIVSSVFVGPFNSRARLVEVTIR